MASARVLSRLSAAASGPRKPIHLGRDAAYFDLDGWAFGVVNSRAVPVPCAARLLTPVDLSCVVGIRPEGCVDLRLDLADGTSRRVRTHSDGVPAPTPLDAAEPGAIDLDFWVGRGVGLTPLGDDVVAGYAAAAYLQGRPVAIPDLRSRTTLLSATLIDGAARGEMLPAFATFATNPSPTTLRPLLAVGHTSGAGLAHGALLRWSEDQ